MGTNKDGISSKKRIKLQSDLWIIS